MARKRYSGEHIIAKLRGGRDRAGARSQDAGSVPEAGHQREHIVLVA